MIADIVTGGYGSFGSVGDVILDGYFSGGGDTGTVALVRVRYHQRPAPIVRFDDRDAHVRFDPPLDSQ